MEKRCCNGCKHIESCVEELYKDGNMPDKFVCSNFAKIKRNEL